MMSDRIHLSITSIGLIFPKPSTPNYFTPLKLNMCNRPTFQRHESFMSKRSQTKNVGGIRPKIEEEQTSTHTYILEKRTGTVELSFSYGPISTPSFASI